jgi:hypothetical protein
MWEETLEERSSLTLDIALPHVHASPMTHATWGGARAPPYGSERRTHSDLMHSARIVDTFLRASLTASLAGGAAFFGGDFRGCGTFSASGCSNGAAALIARPLDLARSASALVGIFTSFSGFLAIVLAGGAALPLPLAAGLATGAGGGGGAAFGGDFFGGDFFDGGAAFFVCEAVCEVFLAGIRIDCEWTHCLCGRLRQVGKRECRFETFKI